MTDVFRKDVDKAVWCPYMRFRVWTLRPGGALREILDVVTEKFWFPLPKVKSRLSFHC